VGDDLDRIRKQVALFGARLRGLRERAGLSRKELARRAGMQSQAGIRNLEQGVRAPGWETVLRLSQALGVNCTAFTEVPTHRPVPRRGRPPKAPGKDKAKHA
jgi:transcriptional regulator with XRE-family HTH domain